MPNKQKARSRLKPSSQDQTRQIFTQPKKQLRENAKELRRVTTNRWRFVPLLILALLFYIAVFWLVTKIRPGKISNLIFPNSYLPFHALLLPANFFFFTFITLSKRWGILITIVIQWLLFLKLQDFNLDLWAWGSALLMGVIGYGLRILWKKRRT